MSVLFDKFQRFVPGKSLRDQLTASRLNRLLAAVERNQLLPGPGYLLSKTGSGTVLEIRGGKSGATSPSPDHPWKPYPAPWTGEGEQPEDWGLRVRLVPGLIGPIFAANWNATFTLGSSAEYRAVWLTIQIDPYGRPTAATIEEGASMPGADWPQEGEALPGEVYYPLFAYDSSASAVLRVYQATRKNLTVSINLNYPACGSTVRSVRIQEVP